MLPCQDPLCCLALSHQRACPEARMTGQRGCSSALHHPCSCPPDWERRGRHQCCSPVLGCPSCLPVWSPAEMRNAEVRGLAPLHTSDQPAPASSMTACRPLLRSPRLENFQAALMHPTTCMFRSPVRALLLTDNACKALMMQLKKQEERVQVDTLFG